MTDALLVREMNHRIANVLQVVVAALTRTLRDLSEPTAIAALQGTISQVRSFSAAHRMLATPGEDTADCDAFLAELCAALHGALACDLGVQVRYLGDPRVTRAQTAHYLGLLVHELVCNAVKHAFPDGRAGTILVELRCSGDSMRCSVRDDGIGVPDAADLARGIGLTLIQMLARQIGGDCTWKALPVGTEAAVTLLDGPFPPVLVQAVGNPPC